MDEQNPIPAEDFSNATKFVIPSKKICIAIPTYKGPSAITYNSLLRASTAAHAKGWSCDMLMRDADSCIMRARCWLLTHFFDHTDCTDLVFIDDDIGFTPEGFIRLLEHPVDVVGGAYRARGEEEHYILRPLANELQRKPPHGLMEVEGLGTGFMRISRRAIELMIARYPDRWYTDPTCPRPDGTRMMVRDFFDFSVENHELHSEDYNFCRLWRAIGGTVWVDPDQRLGHLGSKVFSGCLMDFLQRQMPKIPDSVPRGGAKAWLEGQQAAPATLLDAAKSLVGDAA